MKRLRRFLPGLLACTAFVAVSCADPTAPAPTPTSAAPSADLLGGLLRNTGLLSCSPLAPTSVTQVVGPGGGTIVVGPHTLTIPAGALSSPVAITARIISEQVNRVQFEPDGLQFQKKVTLRMSYANCGLLNQLLPKRIAQVDSGLSILGLLPSLDNLLTQTVSAKLWHFSDYAVASDYVVAW